MELKNLKKRYGSYEALHGISFKVERGYIYGFLGPNGAGKSTTMNIITGTLAATDGSVTIDGHDILREPIEAKRHIGYLPEQPPLYLDMKVTEYLDFVGRAKGLRGSELYAQIDEVIELTDLAAVADRLIKNLSKGYRQRVGIAQAMLGNPDVIILDEPTVGLDPIQIIEIRDLIKSLSESHTVILSSHIMQEIVAVCDRIIIITGGRLVANDTLDGLVEKYCTTVTLRIEARTTAERLRELLSGVDGIDSAEYEDTDEQGVACATLTYHVSCDVREQIWRRLSDARVSVLAFVPSVMSLEDIFISLTSGEAQESDQTLEDVGSADEYDVQNDDAGGDDAGGDDADDGEYKPLFS
ncbi:MAG: ABC transporter ATP-binding protein [Clostridia bacterium]|nr:ABC transporter ATP-binding protein [Clostridia bacterium]